MNNIMQFSVMGKWVSHFGSSPASTSALLVALCLAKGFSFLDFSSIKWV